jgi:hypothetical protein
MAYCYKVRTPIFTVDGIATVEWLIGAGMSSRTIEKALIVTVSRSLWSSPYHETSEVMKMAVFWVVAPCSLVEVYQRFRSPCCLHHQGDEEAARVETVRDIGISLPRARLPQLPDDGGSKDLWNVGKILPDYTATTQKTVIFVLTAVRTSNPT